NLFIADRGLNMVLKMDPKGIISIVAGNGLARSAGDGGPARAASLFQPTNLTVDSSGNLYVVETLGAVIRKVDINGIITTAAGLGLNSGVFGTPENILPSGVAIDTAGNLLITEGGGSNRLLSVSPTGALTVVGGGQAGFQGDGGPV